MWKKTAQFRSIFTTKINKANILLLIILVILNYHFPYHFSESTTSKQSNEKTVYSAPASQDKNPDEKNQAVAGINDSSIIDSDLDRAINLFSSAKVHTTAVNLLKSSSFETEVGGKPRGWFYLLDSNTANTYTSPEGLFAKSEARAKSCHTKPKCAFAYCVHFVDHTPSAGSA